MGVCRGRKGALENEFVMSEFHGNGFPSGVFAVSDGRYKYVECVGERPMLFDLSTDPQELHDLVVEAPDAAATKKAIAAARRWLCNICSPQAVDIHAKKDQRVLRAEMERSGRLVKEVEKRGYLPETASLIPKPELVPTGYKPDGTRA